MNEARSIVVKKQKDIAEKPPTRDKIVVDASLVELRKIRRELLTLVHRIDRLVEN